MGEFDIITVENPKAQSEPPNVEGVTEAPTESVVFTAPKETLEPEVDFTSQTDGVDRKTSVIFTFSSKSVTSQPRTFAPSSGAAVETHIQEAAVDFGKSVINDPGVAIGNETRRQFIETGEIGVTVIYDPFCICRCVYLGHISVGPYVNLYHIQGQTFNVSAAGIAVNISEFNFVLLLLLVGLVVVLIAATFQIRKDILERMGKLIGSISI